MNFSDLAEVAGIFLLSAVKFGIAGVPAAVFAEYSFFKTLTITTSGGIAGTIFFTYLSGWILGGYTKLKHRLFPSSRHKKKKVFTSRNRFLVKVKGKFGLIGLSVLTPSLLSFPLGIFLAVRYYSNKQKIIFYMSLSTFLWAIILYFFYNNLYVKITSFFS